MPTRQPSGFALPDVLVALVLLAIALTGACAVLIQGLRATHGALLASRAADLVTDLAEQAQSATGAGIDSVVERWRSQIPAVLPVDGLADERILTLERVLPDVPSSGPTRLYQLTLRWHGRDADSLRELRVPLLLPSTGTP